MHDDPNAVLCNAPSRFKGAIAPNWWYALLQTNRNTGIKPAMDAVVAFYAQCNDCDQRRITKDDLYLCTDAYLVLVLWINRLYFSPPHIYYTWCPVHSRLRFCHDPRNYDTLFCSRAPIWISPLANFFLPSQCYSTCSRPQLQHNLRPHKSPTLIHAYRQLHLRLSFRGTGPSTSVLPILVDFANSITGVMPCPAVGRHDCSDN